MGPCSITYYAAASSATAGRGVNCLVNNVLTSDAGIPELLVNSAQATVKKVYNYTTADSVVFILTAVGGIYIYDIKIESGAGSAAGFSDEEYAAADVHSLLGLRLV